MPRDNHYFDYEYNDEEYYANQRRKAQQNSSNRRVPPQTNPEQRNRYRDLAEQTELRKNDDVKIYHPKGQAAQQRQNANAAYQQPRQSQSGNHPQQRQNPNGRYIGQPVQNIPGSRPAQRPVVSPAVAQKKKKKKKGGFFRFLRNLLITVLVLYFAASAYIYSLVSHMTFSEDDCSRNDYISSASLKNDPFIENILFIGVDSRGEENSRSDTMILVSIDKKNHKMKLTSFLRDTYVTVPGYGETKLNAACFYGGPKLVVDAIEYNFKIDIDHYMIVDFEAFIQIVDALGGTDVEVTASEAEYMRTAVKVPWVKEGMNHFNGFVTLWYCRIRYLDNDFYRTERQRKVISCLLDEAKKQNPFKLAGEVKEALKYIQTDMSPLKMTLLLEGMGLFYMRYEMLQQQIPYSDEYENRIINEQMVLYIDIPQTAEKIKEFIYG